MFTKSTGCVTLDDCINASHRARTGSVQADNIAEHSGRHTHTHVNYLSSFFIPACSPRRKPPPLHCHPAGSWCPQASETDQPVQANAKPEQKTRQGMEWNGMECNKQCEQDICRYHSLHCGKSNVVVLHNNNNNNNSKGQCNHVTVIHCTEAKPHGWQPSCSSSSYRWNGSIQTNKTRRAPFSPH